jgi:CRP-like cAMP-binding protein
MWPDEQARLIRELPFMLDLSESVQERVQRAIMEVSESLDIPSGRVLFREGDTAPNDGYVLLRGSVRVEKSASPETTAYAPALLGELQQFHPEHRRGATVTALEELDVLRFDWPRLDAALASRLDNAEQGQVREALRRYGWLHFLGEVL